MKEYYDYYDRECTGDKLPLQSRLRVILFVAVVSWLFVAAVIAVAFYGFIN